MNIQNLIKHAECGHNVLLTGVHGVGKTAIISEVFGNLYGEQGSGWRYFSASTLDPWVDFIGLPKNYTRADGKEVFGIIPPENFTGDENIQALFFDEINRADDKVLNALMELKQFRSINGRKFPNLKVIWAAQNPADDDEYKVNELDPAQVDRFDVQMTIPNKVNKAYFVKNFGQAIADIAVEWRESSPSHVKHISPRRLEKILKGYQKGFNLSDFISDSIKKEINIGQLNKNLSLIVETETLNLVLKSDTQTQVNYFTMDMINQLEPILKSNLKVAKEIANIAEHLDQDIVAVLEKKIHPKGLDHISKIKAKKEQEEKDKLLNDKEYEAIRNGLLPTVLVGKFMTATSLSRAHRLLKLFTSIHKITVNTNLRNKSIQLHENFSNLMFAESTNGQNIIEAIHTNDFRVLINESKKTSDTKEIVSSVIKFMVDFLLKNKNKGKKCHTYRLYRKIIGNNDMVNYLNISKSVAKNVYQIHDGRNMNVRENDLIQCIIN